MSSVLSAALSFYSTSYVLSSLDEVSKCFEVKENIFEGSDYFGIKYLVLNNYWTLWQSSFNVGMSKLYKVRDIVII